MSFSSKHNDYLDPDMHFTFTEHPEEPKWVDSPCRICLDHLEREVRQALEYMLNNTKEFAIAWPSFFLGFPSGEFMHKDEEAGDWVMIEDPDTERGWRKVAHAVNIGRNKDGCQWLEFVSVDEDGDWGSEGFYDTNTIEANKKYFYLDSLNFNPLFSLLLNSLYSIHVSRTGKDPLECTIGKKSPREVHLRNLASETLDLCLSVYKKTATKN